MGKASQQKGYRTENNLVNMHKKAGIHAERVPLSGAVKYRGNGGDIDVYHRGPENDPLTIEVKARKDGSGFKQLEAWMGPHHAMLLKRDKAKPMVVITWDLWLAFLNNTVKVNSDEE